jgi:hypothetical protein
LHEVGGVARLAGQSQAEAEEASRVRSSGGRELGGGGVHARPEEQEVRLSPIPSGSMQLALRAATADRDATRIYRPLQ